MPNQGLFITFEGIDGSGKTTQAKLLKDKLFDCSKNTHVLLTREPWKGEEIRRILREEKDAYSGAEQMTKLFIEDRERHYMSLIIPCLINGVHVISDRYSLSTIAYQSAQGMDMDKLIEAHKGFPVPNKTYFVDTPVDVAIKRGAGNEHKFEGENNRAFQEEVRNKYLLAVQKIRESGANITTINGTMKIHEKADLIWQQFSSEFAQQIC
jgi:dTMP kinase